MGKRVGFVVDSTIDLPLSYHEEHGVRMVPLRVRFGEEVLRDWVDIAPDAFYERLRASQELPKTSQPPVQDFADAYSEMARSYDEILSLHINSNLSGTVESARMAAQEVAVPVRVLESPTQTTGGLALTLKLAVEKKEAGVDGDELIAYVETLLERGRTVGMIDSLDYLVKGGRIGRAQGMVGSLLDLKPVIALRDGFISPVGRARGLKKGMAMLLDEMMSEAEPGRTLHLQCNYSDDPGLVESFLAYLAAKGVEYVYHGTERVGPVIGTYLGFGVLMLGYVFL